MSLGQDSKALLIKLLEDKISIINTVLGWSKGEDTSETEARLVECQNALAELQCS